jgi:hypothetical protein
MNNYIKTICICNNVESTDLIKENNVDLYRHTECKKIISVPTNKKCICIYPNSNVIICEDLTMWEIINTDTTDGIVIKLPALATINFGDYYGDDGKANWWSKTFPVCIGDDGVLLWDY